MRATLKEGDGPISLREEIAFARDYADLYNILSPDCANIDFDVHGDAWNASVPRMLLQPLIENAILHGAALRDGGETIVLRARTRDNRLELEIENGVTEYANRNTAGAGIGLANVRERLRVLYGAEQSLSLSRKDGKAVVSLRLPFRVAAAPET